MNGLKADTIMVDEMANTMWSDKEIAMFNKRHNHKINRGNWIWRTLNLISKLQQLINKK